MQNGLGVHDYSAKKVKRSVVGYGQAEKGQVQHMIRVLLGLSSLPSVDAADALAVAVCHAHSLFTLPSSL
jgi:crossover junction endodeoxyribonuclease RuvC